MRSFRPLLPLALVLSAGCPTETVDRGTVLVTLDGGRPPGGEGYDLMLENVAVLSVTPAAGDAPLTIALEDGADVRTVGLSVRDADGVDATPALDLAEGDVVSLVYRYRFVWGDVAGFALHDADGLVVAAEEGAWGGSDVVQAVPGLAVRRGDDVVAREATDCVPIEGYSLVFEGDEAVELVPVAEAPVVVGGAELTAVAVASWDYGESTSCAISDATGFQSWVVYR